LVLKKDTEYYYNSVAGEIELDITLTIKCSLSSRITLVLVLKKN
jgi:hypothetical protein